MNPPVGRRPTPLGAAVWLGPDVAVPSAVDVILADGVDAATTEAVTEALRAAGATDVRAGRPAEPGDPAPLRVGGGPSEGRPPPATLRAVGLDVPGDLPAEGYALAAFAREDGTSAVVLAGVDAAGMFYAAQTLRQLVNAGGGAGTIAGVGIVDQPAMRHRGVIEGFYGSPWTHEERLDQLNFYGRFKLNAYVYAPKDDPYHRDRWRDPYPPDQVAELRALIDAATANHVRFTFAVSPGVSICYSDPADVDALAAKLDALYRLGARAFSIALDDIVHTRWNCDGDRARYGAPSAEAAARAQVELLNGLQRGFVAERDGAEPLQMVPTEYRTTADSPYRRIIREQLDPAIEVMWTGPMVVPDEITVDDAADAATVFGRPTFVWDNTPVNDFPATQGRLILAPDFTWNDAAYDPARAHRAAAAYLAGRTDPDTVDALLAFFDVENLAPTSARSGTVSQPQAPVLAQQLDTFRTTWASGDRAGAVGALRPYAQRLGGAPALIPAGGADEGFVTDCRPWLDAADLWGDAPLATIDALEAKAGGDAAGAQRRVAGGPPPPGPGAAPTTNPGGTPPPGPGPV